MDVQCGFCCDVIRQKQQKLTCQLCEVTYHRVCTSLKQDEYRSMNRDRTLDSWQCQECGDNTGVQSDDLVSKETEEQSVVTTPSIVQNVCTVTDWLSTVSSPATAQILVSTSSSVQSIMSTSADVQSTMSTSAGAQSVMSTSAGAQSVMSTSAGAQSVMSTSADAQSVMSTSAGAQSVMSTSAGVQNDLTGSKGASVFKDVIVSLSDIMSKTHCNGQNQSQEQSSQIRDSSLNTELEQRTTKGASEPQTDVQTSANNAVGVDKDVLGNLYTCCSVHGVVNPKKTVKTGKELVQLVQTPFMEKVEDIVPPRIIVGASKYLVETFSFHLTKNQLEMIRQSQTSKKNDVQVRIRSCRFNVKSVQEELTLPGLINVNSNYASLKTSIDVDKNEKCKNKPVDITCLLRMDLSRNTVRISHSAKENYYLTCELARRRTVDDLVDLLTIIHPEHTEDLIKEKFMQEDGCEISTTNLKASLICPIGKMRLTKPCRSKHCTHVQCVDARTVLSLNQNKPTWKCPICQNPAEYDDLCIDGLFLNILASVPWDVVEVEFLKDGSWTHKKSASQRSVDIDMDKENNCVLLDETIDKFDVIDLTETDEECSPVKRAPLKTNTSLINRMANVKKPHQNDRFSSQCNTRTSRLDSRGSTCSNSSTTSISSDCSTSHRPVVNINSERPSQVFSSAYRRDNSSYGCHRNNRHLYQHRGPYSSSSGNYNRNFGYRNNFSGGNYYQTTVDQYAFSWRNNNNYRGNIFDSVNMGNNNGNNYC